MSPASRQIGCLQVFNKRQSTVSDKIGDTQKFGTSADRNLADDGDSTFIFSKVIGSEMYHSSIADLYSLCPVGFASNAVVTEALHFLDLGIPGVNVLDEVDTFGAPATRIRRPKDQSHWSTSNHIFGKN